MLMRSLLERLSRDRVLRRRLPPEFGGHSLFVSPDAALKLWRRDLGRTDPLLLSLAVELVRPGSVVWDIGANVGIFVFAAAHRAGPTGRILAVEADDWLAGLVRRSASAAEPAYAPVDVLAAAVSDRCGVAEFRIANRGRAGSHLSTVGGTTQTGGHREVRKLVTVTLDGLLEWFASPRVVKIDVEGAEAQCLRGAEVLLASVRPAIACEVSAENKEEIREILHRHRYQIFDAAAPPADRRPLAAPAWNTLALPTEEGWCWET